VTPSATSPLASSICCGGCGTVLAPDDPYPFRCPRAGDGADHVVHRLLDTEAVEFPFENAEPNGFVRFRDLLHSYHLATAAGMADDEYVGLARELDAKVANVDGRGFAATPLSEMPLLASRIGLGGPLYVKDETGNVSGSHKARHLFGLLVHLEVVERLGMTDTARRPPLAIASCGNAALAAAVVAAAGGRLLRVFVPTDAEPAVLKRLDALGAEIVVCERTGAGVGDPTYLRLKEDIAAGSLPFTCQGNENGLAIEGGETLGYEMAADLHRAGASLDHVVVQVGGGALASAVAQSLRESVELGVIGRMPRLHTVQTESAWPLRRAFLGVRALLGSSPRPREIEEVVRYAGEHRAQFMWPWETAPHSVAHGILDDETYDWLAVVDAMLRTGGEAVVVGEDELLRANRLAADTSGRDVDATGSSGLAGLIKLVAEGVIAPGESAGVLFTGVRR
jgi:threonine synthase